MKKVICLMFVMFASTIANAYYVACPYLDTDLGIFEIMQPKTGAQVLVGLISPEIVFATIPSTTNAAYNCAYNNQTEGVVTSGGKGLANTKEIFTKEISLLEKYVAFQCFCKVSPRLLNKCTIIISDDYIATCSNGMVTYSVRGFYAPVPL